MESPVVFQPMTNRVSKDILAWAVLVAISAAGVPLPVHGQTFRVLFTFVQGENPQGVIRDSAGNFYGVSKSGGSYNSGTVFKIDTQYKETVLYTFTGGADGGAPETRLLRDKAGNLYGVASMGGNTACASTHVTGCGVVFKVDTSGKYSVLYSFSGSTDGWDPAAPLTMDSKGNLYGTTIFGGDACNCGTLFKLDTTGTFSVLHTFLGNEQSDGEDPQGNIVIDSADNLFGTTWQGGATCFTCGTIYKVDSAGNETILHPFAGLRDGSQPQGTITNGALLCGTTYSGGPSDKGTVFTMDKSGTESVLYSFTGSADGRAPTPSLARDSKGNVYGTTTLGGDSGYGVVFELDSKGHETVLYTFSGKGDGGFPFGLIRDGSGNLYGLSSNGLNQGLLFEITP